jgi:hypothetical protein
MVFVTRDMKPKAFESHLKLPKPDRSIELKEDMIPTLKSVLFPK